MLIRPPERVARLLDVLNPFLDTWVPPLEARLLQGGARFVDLLPEIERARAEAKRLGLWAPAIPAEHGGLGLSVFELAFIGEQLGRSPLGHYLVNAQAPDAGNIELLARFGTEAQRARFLAPLVAGTSRSCFTMTEPDLPGSNPVLLGTTARDEGDTWVIDGRKWFATAAEGADVAIAMVVTDPDVEKLHHRASMILVPTDTPGFRIVRNLPVMGEAGSGWASHAEVVYEGCRVPKENLLGPRGHGFKLAQDRLGPGRIHHCMRWIGIAERVFDLMCRRAVDRQLMPFVPLASRQLVQVAIAESRAEIDGSRMLVLDAAHRIDEVGTEAAKVQISVIKFTVAGMLGRVLDRALQVHGGLGMLDDTPIAWWYRHERAARIYDGADEVHKSAVARAILEGYGLKLRG